ncbi:TonB family protein [Cloacibacillus sp.]|uniref:energy transducer TonB n=1 Tax=Cloacibacillus sp. TaxID=2049023 RepID=UPI0025BCE3E9|nr:TonB family protein [Cloacibacillus sp.]MCC8059135.1 TonB family protein [Cloacibacillus sp.]MCC8059140.1 TonB family protein [Cloacibacillus sp.]
MTFLSGERGRWAAALLISLLLHCALIFIFGGAKAEKKPEPVMNVKLVFAPAAAGNKGGGSGGGKTVEKKVPQPKKEQAVKPVSKQPTVKKKKEAPIKEISARPAENKETAANAPAETAAATDGAEEGNGTDGGSGTGGGGTGAGSGSGEEGGIADVNSLEVTHKVLPDYPAFSRKRKEEGTAVIIAAVENGRVQSVEIEKTSGYDRLDNSALRAVRGWRFRHEGRIRVRIPFVFKIR